MTTLRANSLAKINLFLHITGKEIGNYHSLDSLIVFAEDVYDVITITSSAEYQLNITGDGAKQLIGRPNIITTAVDALCKHFGKKPAITITLNKHLPLGSGIGGGSSNAATIVKLLCKLWQVDDPGNDFLKSIGADVPACYFGEACYANGIGEIITPIIKFPDLWAVLVNPNIHITTSQIFKMGLEQFFKPEINHQYNFDSSDELIDLLKHTQNDLYFNSLQLVPILGNVIQVISECDDCVISRMSGSGATCFGLFTNKLVANAAANKLQSLFPGYFIRTTKLK